jgi:regulator of cell morphogenesis and NO signaling
MITQHTKMADLIHADVFTLSVLHRLHIPLGFGDETIQDVCGKNNINSEVFVYMVNLFMYDIVPDTSIENRTIIPDLLSYLQLTHRYYLTHHLPLIEGHIQKVLDNEPQRKQDIFLLSSFFEKYKTEFFLHLENEDDNVFPYVEKLFSAFVSGHADENFINQVATSPIARFEKDHDDLEEKLNDLKNIIIKYLQPFKSVHNVHQILILLFQLEKDVNQHARLEDLLLVPLVEKTEKELLIKYKRQNG